jgi:hypothetical protein
MPERLRTQVLRRLPREWLLGCAASLAVLPALGAESLPASVRACSTISDSNERLSCYDREVASFPAPEAKVVAKSAPAAASGGAAGGGSEGGNGLAANSHTASSNATASSGTNPATPAAAAGSGTSSQPSASGGGVGNDAAAAGASGSAHISAHLVRIERFPNEMIFHLDNGQVWQELQSVPGDLSLREGDAVKIDLHWGSYWLTGPHVYSMKVRLKT